MMYETNKVFYVFKSTRNVVELILEQRLLSSSINLSKENVVNNVLNCNVQLLPYLLQVHLHLS